MTKRVDLSQDPEEMKLGELLAWCREEADALEVLLPALIDAQWSPSPNPRPREDTSERSKNTKSDPTFATVSDERRWKLRAQVVRSERIIREAIVALRGVRLGAEYALAAWEGTEQE